MSPSSTAGFTPSSSAELAVEQAEIHALLGENGAGKSTLVKVVAGVVRPEEGEIRVDGEVVDIRSPHTARERGIAIVFQELSLIPQLTVAHNLVLNRFPRRAGLLSLKKAQRIAEETLAKLGLVHIDPRVPVSQLPLDQQQMVEIAKATMIRPKILILDEATSSLGRAEVEKLFDLVTGIEEPGNDGGGHHPSHAGGLGAGRQHDDPPRRAHGRSLQRRRDRPTTGGEPDGRPGHQGRVPGQTIGRGRGRDGVRGTRTAGRSTAP